MSIVLFILHYLLALGFLAVPEKWTLYYGIGLIVYLFMYYGKIKTVNPYRDIHPFVIGYASAWVVELLPIGHMDNLFMTVLLVLYSYLLYREKKTEELGNFSKNQIGRSAVYTIAIPFSAFLTTLYLTETNDVAFVVYYATLFYGLYSSRFMMRFKGYVGFLLLNTSLIMVYTYQYLDIHLIEKGLYMALLTGAVVMARRQEKKRLARGA